MEVVQLSGFLGCLQLPERERCVHQYNWFFFPQSCAFHYICISEMFLIARESVRVSCGCCNESPKSGGLKKAEMYSLTALEAGSLSQGVSRL